jgi:hypothetical protein
VRTQRSFRDTHIGDCGEEVIASRRQSAIGTRKIFADPLVCLPEHTVMRQPGVGFGCLRYRYVRAAGVCE